MNTWEWGLLAVAFVMLVTVYKVGAIWYDRVEIYPEWGGLAAAVIVWLIGRNVYPWLADRADGDKNWWGSELFRWGLIVGFSLTIGYLVMAWIRREPSDP